MDPVLIGQILGAVLTLMVFSYLLGNNPLYRLAQHLFVGISIGYATLVLVGGVLIPEGSNLLQNLGSPAGWLLSGVPLLLGLYVLVIRMIRPAAQGGNVALTIAVSTAAALAVGGALAGTLIPQLADTMRPLRGDGVAILNNLIIVIGVAVALFYFGFGLPERGTRSPAGALVVTIGRWFIVVTLGAVLGTLTVTFVASLVERIDAIRSIFL